MSVIQDNPRVQNPACLHVRIRGPARARLLGVLPRATDDGHLLTTDRQFWHCVAHTAEPKIGARAPIPCYQNLLFYFGTCGASKFTAASALSLVVVLPHVLRRFACGTTTTNIRADAAVIHYLSQ